MIFKSQHYQVAYRRNGKLFSRFPLENGGPEFQLIPNTWRYWAADPFLYEHEGKVYLFAELYDFVHRKGVIGFAEWKNNRFTKWKPIIEEPFHMSYPHVFGHNGDVYMIPETYQAKKLILYKATRFPCEWELCKTLLTGESLVDTTIISIAGGGLLALHWKARMFGN